MTFEAWRTLVKLAYQGGEPAQAALLMAVKDGARSVTVRDVESDLALARSYENSFAKGKVKMAGARITANLADTITAVRAIMPIDADTAAIDALLDNAIESAYNDVQGIADKFDAYLIQAAIDLQRHVPFYQVRQLTTFLYDSDGVTNEGFISRVALPATARIQQVWYGHYYPPLEPDVEYAVDDIVISNGRAYKVGTGGTLTSYEIGAGLTSTDGNAETLGDLVFHFYTGKHTWPVRKLDWNSRNMMLAGRVAVGPVYAFPPQSDELWFYPILDATHRFDLEWVGVTEDFDDSDEVTFDQTAAEAAAHYIRALLSQTELDDRRTAADSLALYQKAVRKAVVDNQARDTGSPTSVALYDWRRRAYCCGTRCGIVTQNSDNGSTTTMTTNSEHAQTTTGAVAPVTAQSSNHVEQIAFNGLAGARPVTLNINKQTPTGTTRCTTGDRIVIVGTFEVAGLDVTFYNSTQSGANLGAYSSEYTGEVRRFEFFFDGTQWQFLAP